MKKEKKIAPYESRAIVYSHNNCNIELPRPISFC